MARRNCHFFLVAWIQPSPSSLLAGQHGQLHGGLLGLFHGFAAAALGWHEHQRRHGGWRLSSGTEPWACCTCRQGACATFASTARCCQPYVGSRKNEQGSSTCAWCSTAVLDSGALFSRQRSRHALPEARMHRAEDTVLVRYVPVGLGAKKSDLKSLN